VVSDFIDSLPKVASNHCFSDSSSGRLRAFRTSRRSSAERPRISSSMTCFLLRHYHYIKGIGENVQLDFAYVARYSDYLLTAPSQNLLDQADPNPDRWPMTPEKMQLYVVPDRAPKIRFKDLEAILVSRIVRDQVKFSHRIEFAPATQATTLARIDIQIPCETCAHDGQIVPSPAYQLSIRVSKPSGWVVDTSELTADIAVHDGSDSRLTLDAHLDVPLAPGTYQLAVVAKNAATGEVGVVRGQIDVPSYGALEKKLRTTSAESHVLSSSLRLTVVIPFRSTPERS
jgi:hypothetical protein